ncbi:hypothetical protein C7212DRAFT_225615 [Tuber magnatum]|uniref:RAVE subunit 2/Rogdi n=1 Tax=Tuber magnatum TaxID=42249 RepID=A0A317SEU2_9PEZI|nr:hypothetical protein C7212DRAFT_225615 [Tuber magnatum]
MAAALYPPRPEEDTLKAEEESAARELAWLLSSLQETIDNVRSGLRECSNLLTPSAGSTLVLSSPRSESLKGFATRVANRVVKSDMQVKMHGLPNTKGSACHKLSLDAKGKGIVLEQLADVGNHVAEGLEIVDGGRGRMGMGMGVAEKLHGVMRSVRAARDALRGIQVHRLFPYHATDPRIFDPPLHPHLAFDLYISEAALIVELRTLDLLSPSEHRGPTFALPSLESPFGFRERFAAAVGLRNGGNGVGAANQDEIYSYKGGDVRVREKVRVESQDPSLMAIWAKLGGLEHALGLAIKSLDIVKYAAGLCQ